MEKTILKEVGKGLMSVFTDVSPFSMFVTYGGLTLTWLFGAWDLPLQILLTVIFVDYAMGVLRAIRDKKLNSTVGLNGLMKKSAMMIVLSLAVLLDRLLGSDQWICRTATAFLFISNEGFSILENAASLGAPVSDNIVSVLEQLRSGEKKERK